MLNQVARWKISLNYGSRPWLSVCPCDYEKKKSLCIYPANLSVGERRQTPFRASLLLIDELAQLPPHPTRARSFTIAAQHWKQADMRTTALLLLLTGATSGNPHPTQGNRTASEGTCSYEVGLDYHNGQGMGATAAESADDCCAQCSSEEGQKKGMLPWHSFSSRGNKEVLFENPSGFWHVCSPHLPVVYCFR